MEPVTLYVAVSQWTATIRLCRLGHVTSISLWDSPGYRQAEAKGSSAFCTSVDFWSFGPPRMIIPTAQLADLTQ